MYNTNNTIIVTNYVLKRKFKASACHFIHEISFNKLFKNGSIYILTIIFKHVFAITKWLCLSGYNSTY